MSYLNLSDGIPGFNQTVISFWFRVPAASIAQVAAAAPQRMNGILPLLTFGPLIDGYEIVGSPAPDKTYFTELWVWAAGDVEYEFLGLVDDSNPDGGIHTYSPGTAFSLGNSIPGNPSFVGLACNSDGTAELKVRVVVAKGAGANIYTTTWMNFGNGKQLGNWFNTDVPVKDTALSSSGTLEEEGVVPDGTRFITNSWQDYTNVWLDSFGADAFEIGYNIAVTPDVWHHVLISLDLDHSTIAKGSTNNGGTVAGNIANPCKAWIALDDVNYDMTYLNPSSGLLGLNGPNDVASQACLGAASSQKSAGPFSKIWNPDGLVNITETDAPPTPTYIYNVQGALSDKQPFGIPAAANMVDNIYKVEMAEFVMWTDVTLDTSVEANRRLFITAPDKNGKQYSVNPTPIYIPMTKTAVGDPPTWDWDTAPDTPAFVPPLSSMDPSVIGSGNKLLGTPIIDFTKSSQNWMMGRNLGSAKSKVVKTGKIKAYFPDPSIGG